MALLTLIAIALVFAASAFKKFPMHLGVLAIGLTAIIGRMAGIADADLIALFPTTLFVRLIGTMLLFSIAQINGCFDLLAKKIMSKMGSKIKLMPFVIYFIGLLMMTSGGSNIPAMTLLSAASVSLAVSVGVDPLLFGIAAIYGSAAGAYFPIANFSLTIAEMVDIGGLTMNPMGTFFSAQIVFLIILTVNYFILGGHKLKIETDYSQKELPSFTKKNIMVFIGVVMLFVLTMAVKIDIAFVSILISIVLITFGCAKGDEAVKTISFSTLVMIGGMGMLIALAQKLGGFELLSNALSSIMTKATAPSIMSLTASTMSLFTISLFVVQSLIPTIPGILANIPGLSASSMITAASIGPFAACIGPLSLGGALIIAAVGQNLGEDVARKNFSKQMGLGILGAVIASLIAATGIYNIFG